MNCVNILGRLFQAEGMESPEILRQVLGNSVQQARGGGCRLTGGGE